MEQPEFHFSDRAGAESISLFDQEVSVRDSNLFIEQELHPIAVLAFRGVARRSEGIKNYRYSYPDGRDEHYHSLEIKKQTDSKPRSYSYVVETSLVSELVPEVAEYSWLHIWDNYRNYVAESYGAQLPVEPGDMSDFESVGVYEELTLGFTYGYPPERYKVYGHYINTNNGATIWLPLGEDGINSSTDTSSELELMEDEIDSGTARYYELDIARKVIEWATK